MAECRSLLLSSKLIFSKGTNCALWSIIALGCYVRAVVLGEEIVDMKVNRGKAGQA